MDEPPRTLIELTDLAPGQDQNVVPHLPSETREDGTIVIDLTSLAPPPPTKCLEREPDPLNPEIVVCSKTGPSPRLPSNYGPNAEELIEGSAIPRARLRLSDNAEIEANATSPGVGGFNATGGEVRVKIDF